MTASASCHSFVLLCVQEAVVSPGAAGAVFLGSDLHVRPIRAARANARSAGLPSTRVPGAVGASESSGDGDADGDDLQQAAAAAAAAACTAAAPGVSWRIGDFEAVASAVPQGALLLNNLPYVPRGWCNGSALARVPLTGSAGMQVRHREADGGGAARALRPPGRAAGGPAAGPPRRLCRRRGRRRAAAGWRLGGAGAVREWRPAREAHVPAATVKWQRVRACTICLLAACMFGGCGDISN